MDLEAEVAIIGAGTAGLAAERAARHAGAKTLLIDEFFAGTTCASVGCMPSKLLIAAARAAKAVTQAPLFGVAPGGFHVEGKAVMKRLRAERNRFVASAKEQIERVPANARIKSRAQFAGSNRLKLDDGRYVEARAIVIATGATPKIPTGFDSIAANVLTNETLFELPDLPRSLAVIGAGPLGLELAQALALLGVKVVVLDESAHFGGMPDKDISQIALNLLRRDFDLRLEVSIHAELADGGVRLTWSGASPGEAQVDKVLVAAGRPPALAALELASTGLALDEHGVPEYDPLSLQCGSSSIFIAGDANRDRPVLHEASAEGAIAGSNAAGFPHISRSTRFSPLAVTFTDPQMAVLGHIPTSHSAPAVVGRASFADQGRAKVEGTNHGRLHLFADPAKGRLQGAAMVGPCAEHLAHLLTWAVQLNLTADEVLRLPFYHPTYEEGVKSALRSICEQINIATSDGVVLGE